MNLIFSPWIPLFALVCMAIVARFYQRSWLAPSAFAPLIWSIYILVPLSIAPAYKVSGLSVWIIVFLISCVQLGAMFGEKRGFLLESPADPKPRFSKKQILLFVVFLSVIATTGELYFAYTSLLENGMSLTLNALIAIGHLLSVDRYSGVQEPTLVRLLVTWMYPAALLGGLIFKQGKSRVEKALSLCPILPALLSGFFQSTKAPVLMVVCCWISAYFATQIQHTQGLYKLFNRRLLALVTALVISAAALFVLLDAIRVHQYGDDLHVSADWSRIEGSTIGYLSVFSDWLNHENIQPLGFGAYTFAGFFNSIGIHSRALGLYEDIVVLPGQVDSNIYTAFRGLIQDFSLPGAALFCILFGVIGGVSYDGACAGRTFGIVMLSAYFAFLIWSPLASIAVYNGPLLGWMICSFIFRESPSFREKAMLPAVSFS